ncbi:MAG: LysM peptidoglycan-binding domain-containing protein, partial [Gammaproteobacteria bacterium]|nr:LysM peptidoglycan-binding domain-containing protein [Gammaproteobacteria bacterium]
MLGHFKKLVLGLVCVGFCVNSAWAETTVGPVKRGDSLWRIAVQHRPSKHTNLYQMIAAIQKLNPSAFHGNDLLPGSMLKVPTTHDEIVAALAGAAVSSTSNASQKSAASAPAVKASAVKTESATPSAESVVKTGAKAEVHSEKKASAPVSSPVIHSAASNTPAAPVMPTNLIAPNAPSANAGATVSNAKENAEIAPVLSVSQGAPAPAQKSNSDASDNVSLWSWVWFALL